MARRPIVAVLSHVACPLIVGNVRRMAEEIPTKRLILCYDNTNGTYSAQDWEGIPGLEVMLFTFDECMAANRLHIKNKDNYDTIMGLLYGRLLRDDPDWDYTWFIENDVMCKGNWGRALARADPRTEDMLATRTSRYDLKNADWGGWGALHHWKDLPMAKRCGAFVAIARYSRRMMHRVHEMLGILSGWSEIYPSTLCVQSGYTLGDLPGEMIGAWFDWMVRGEEVWNAYLAADDGRTDVLVHPVKPPTFVVV